MSSEIMLSGNSFQVLLLLILVICISVFFFFELRKMNIKMTSLEMQLHTNNEKNDINNTENTPSGGTDNNIVFNSASHPIIESTTNTFSENISEELTENKDPNFGSKESFVEVRMIIF